MFLRINNFIKPSGIADYKGLDTSYIQKGSQVFISDNNFTLIIYKGGDIQHADITKIDEFEYTRIKKIQDDIAASYVTTEEEVLLLKEENKLLKVQLNSLSSHSETLEGALIELMGMVLQ